MKFGSARNVREDVWEWNTVGVIEDLWRDLRYVGRTLRRAPGFALAVIMVMALGIGAVTAMFTIVRSVLLKPLPFGDRERLVMLYERSADGKFPFNSVAGGSFLEWQREAKNFEQIAAWQQAWVQPFGVERAIAGIDRGDADFVEFVSSDGGAAGDGSRI